MERVKPAHPKTEVNFAATEVFEKHFGHAEAQRQQRGFDRPSWAKAITEPKKAAVPQPPPVDAVPQLVLGGLFLGGVAIGIAITYWLWTNRS